MSINHHNYEEYFILYMDNELSNDDRCMVETFVQQNPHLKEELDLLFQYKLTPDSSVIYNGKEDLMKVNPAFGGKSSDAPVTLTNCEEWLVLYMDNELTASQKATVDKFLAANPSVKEEFALLQRTQIQPEVMFFSDKAVLYRTEEKTKPAPVSSWRLAAAAVLLLGIGITTAILINKKSSPGNIAKGTSTKKIIDTQNQVVPNKELNNTAIESIAAENDNNKGPLTPDVKQATANNVIARKNKIVPKYKLPVIIIPQPVKDEQAVATTNKTNNLPKPLENPNLLTNDKSNSAIATTNISKEIINPKNSLTNNTVTTQNPQPSNIVNASYSNTDDGAALDQSNGKKNKNRGFFRKIARTFEKRTDIDPTDDNKLLVAGLSIRLK